MIKTVPLKQLTCYYGNDTLQQLDLLYVDKLAKEKAYLDVPVITDCNYNIIDGHCRYLAADRNKETHIKCIVLNVPFIETDNLRSFLENLKLLPNKEYHYKNEFDKLFSWIISHTNA